ncbi:MAG: UDP-N-acetylmuramoyl-tripeptide--D-alanyl-D-alanine ligase [Patescibacteria group bacterium]
MKTFLKSFVIAILTFEASLLLKRHHPTIVAVTGSVGKTSTKDAIYAAVKGSVSARKSQKSFNSEIGVPLTVLGLSNGWNNPFLWLKNIFDGLFIALFVKEYPAVLILEAGVDQPGDMAKLTAWVKPDIVVLTRLPAVPVHVEFFKTLEAIVAEKMVLLSALKPNGTLVYNNDDEIIAKEKDKVRQRQVGFGRYAPTDFTASADRIVYRQNIIHGLSFVVSHVEESHTVTAAGVVGTQSVYNVTAALAVADVLGVPLSAAVANLADLQTPNGRMRIIPGLKGSTLIDDTYNSSPAAAEAALSTLREISLAKRKIAVLGDMLELGSFSNDAHRKLGEQAAAATDLLLTVGIRARVIAAGALAAGLPEEKILQYEDVERAGRELQGILQSGDVVLIKASQSIRAERIVEEVMADPDHTEQLLVRQEPEWKKKKITLAPAKPAEVH